MTNTIDYAQQQDATDVLSSCRDEFHIPTHQGKEVIYLTGNSLGLQPKTTASYIQQELDKWATYGVDGHFQSDKPWYSYHELFSEKIARLVGALPSEVVVTHSLTTNLHLLMVSFFRPFGRRTKILCESKAFPSDRYALESQLRFHGLDPATHLIEITPRQGEYTLRTEDIIAKINAIGGDLALLMMGGVNYYTGQFFDIKNITEVAHRIGAMVGWDMAHAAGNVPLSLHDWEVDFAVWCSYKYLCSSPGGVAGMFIHQKYENTPRIPRFAGWWGYEKNTRFLMEPNFVPALGAEGWQLSNAPILGMAAHLAALDIFDRIGMDKIHAKQKKLTAFIRFIIEDVFTEAKRKYRMEIITPKNPDEHGAQLSLHIHLNGRTIFEELSQNGVVIDWREPNVMRLAPSPLYNSFTDCFLFGKELKKALKKLS